MKVNAKTEKFSNKFELDGIKFEEPVPNLFLLIIRMGHVLFAKGSL